MPHLRLRSEAARWGDTAPSQPRRRAPMRWRARHRPRALQRRASGPPQAHFRLCGKAGTLNESVRSFSWIASADVHQVVRGAIEAACFMRSLCDAHGSTFSWLGYCNAALRARPTLFDPGHMTVLPITNPSPACRETVYSYLSRLAATWRTDVADLAYDMGLLAHPVVVAHVAAADEDTGSAFTRFDAGGVEGLVRAGQQKTLLRVGPVRLFFVEMETGRVKFPRILYEGAPAGRANFRRPEIAGKRPDIEPIGRNGGTERFSVDEGLPEAMGCIGPRKPARGGQQGNAHSSVSPIGCSIGCPPVRDRLG